MKKTFIFCLVLSLLLLSHGPVNAAEKTTTIMVYMAGSDIQQDAVDDIQEMLQAETGGSVRIAVEAGGTRRWDQYFKGGKINRCVISDHQMHDLQALPNRNMGQADTLADFLQWGVSACPADRYVLVFWDHGGGAGSGVCWDETNGDDFLSLTEIASGIGKYQQENPGFRLDVIGFDACLMGNYETAAHISSYADFMVASEETEPSYAWDYTAWISTLGQQAGMDSQTLCVTIADTYLTCSHREDPNEPVSLSVTYLPAIPDLTLRLEAFATYLSGALDSDQLNAMSRARRNMYDFGSFADSASGCVDMGAFLNGTRQFAPSTAAEVETAYRKAVRYSAGNKSFDYLTGLSIFFPQSREELEEASLGDCFPNHKAFITEYVSLRAGGDYSFAASFSSPQWEDGDDLYGDLYGEDSSCYYSPSGSCYTDEPDYSDWDWGGYEDEPADDFTDLPDVISFLDGEAGQYGDILPEEEEDDGYPFAEAEGTPVGGYSIQLGQDELLHLARAEGQLYIADFDDDMNLVILMSTMQNVAINWDNGRVTSLCDGEWTLLGEQPVVVYDVVRTSAMRRSTIPVRLNGQEGYLVATRAGNDSEWTIIGFSTGYDENGMPMKGIRKLQEGDTIVPVYTAYGWEDDGDPEETTVDGDPVTVGEAGRVELVSMPMEKDETEPLTMLFAFELEDIYGETQLTDFVSFEI